MSYKISKKNKKENYYSEFLEAERTGSRNFFGIPRRIRQKNEIVEYKDDYAIVRKATKKGIYIEPFKVGKDDIAVPSGKIIFVSNEKAEHIYPAMLPNLMIADLLV